MFSNGLRVETRSLNGGQARVIGGYAAVFGKRSHPMGGIREVVEPSFFNKSKSDGWPMVVARFEHDPRMLLGSTASRTLELKLDNTGLDYSVRVPETRSDVWELAERGDLPGSSFSFQAYDDDWRLGDGGMPERHLVSGRLIDVAPTAIPAYPDATVKTLYRSLSLFADVDEEDVIALAAQGELRSLFTRTDLAVSAPPTVLPGVEHRSNDAAQRELTLRRRLNEERGKRYGGLDMTDPAQALLDLYRRRNRNRARRFAPETRSVLDDYQRAAFLRH
ncbi:hypothetical protein BST37_08380 [Mycobacterium noviomagense]|uniref:Prohead serine protease domain-containing protein n=1 Tax=Mycobacterium noviomagense TaxID=459858 RepID=A0ABX3T7D2_9MYCO|nr:hypothetical protein BST37_08380 [Mycobacterium noviomagense]